MAKKILITGASSGIGEETARYLSSMGYECVLVARTQDKLECLAKELPTKSLVIPFDLMQLEQIEDIFKKCKEENILLDGMVHSAGRAELMPVRRNDISLMKADMTLNYFSFVELCKYFYSKRYSREGSSIIALSSLSARTCYAGALNYTASKASVNVAVKTIAKEFLKRKIRVNAILPANVNTSLTQNEMSFVREDNSDQSMGFVAVETVAQMIEFLLSDKAAYVTGAEIPISAGMII